MRSSRTVLFALFLISLFYLPQAQAQNGVPLTIPLFQNDDAFCQDQSVVDDSFTVTCGEMTDDSVAGQLNFPDCVNITERRSTMATTATTDQASYIQNSNLHDSAACPKNQMDAAQTIQITYDGSGTATEDQIFGTVSNANFDGMNFNDFIYPLLPTFGGERMEEWLGSPGGGFALLGDVTVMNPTYPRVLDLQDDPDDGSSPFRTDPFARSSGLGSGRCANLNVTGGWDACPAERNSRAFDCNADGFPDVTTAVVGDFGGPLGIYLATLRNSNGDLQDRFSVPPVPPDSSLVRDISMVPDPSSLPGEAAAAFDDEDFNNDGNPDVAAVLSIKYFQDGNPITTQPQDYLVLCENNSIAAGACGFNCNFTIDLSTLITEANYNIGGTGSDPFSIAAGDFNGDGQSDVVISFIGQDTAGGLLSRVVYLFGDGSGTFNAGNSLQVSTAFDSVGGGTPLLSVAGAGQTDVVPTSLTTGQFDNDGILDVAVTNYHSPPGEDPDRQRFTSVGPQGFVLVLRSDGTMGGGFNPTATPLQFPVQNLNSVGPNNVQTPFQAPYDRNSGMDTADFDHCGGDDIITLAESCPGGLINEVDNGTQNYQECTVDPGNDNFAFAGERQAVVFLNANEAPVVTIGPNVPTDFPTTIGATLPATCTDPTNDDRSYQWSLVSGPAGSTVSFGTPSGTLVDPNSDAMTTVVPSTAGDYVIQLSCTDFCGLTTTAQVTITSAGGAIPGANTQGGNFFCSMGSNGGATGAGAGVALLILGLGALLALRFRRGVLLGLIALCLLAGGIPEVQALTNSVSVNTFTPTVDDSDFITVYGSETMLKRNFHVGFFLDYAYRPYEFGNANFDRVSGIVDHLLDANIVGSYGVLDWFTVGVAIPVHLYESLNAPLLGINESNFALGDVELYFKFRVLDREKHGVGIAVIPFVRFPTSTNSTDFLGDGSFGGGGIIVIDGKIGERVSLALNLGYNVRGKFIDVGGNEINDEFLASLGLSVAVIKNVFHIIGEFQTATVVNNFYSSQRTTPLEGRVGFRYTWANNHDINAGVGLGVLHGIGQPAIRGFVGYTYTKRPLAEVTVPPPPMNEIQVGDELTLKDKIYFDFDRWSIRDISKPTLDKIAGFLKAHPEVTKIKIDGYTCDLGTNSYNDRLSGRRANSVKNYLEAQGISPDRIGTVQGYGEANPLVPNTDEANREQNRRVQIFVEAVNNAQ